VNTKGAKVPLNEATPETDVLSWDSQGQQFPGNEFSIKNNALIHPSGSP